MNPRNLQLIKDYQSSKNLSVEAPASPDKVKGKKVPAWLLGDREPEAVKTEAGWPKLLSNTEDLNNIMWLK